MRILYLQRVTIEPMTYRAIMSIEFSDVKLNEGVDDETFRFELPPQGVQDFDETNLYIDMIEVHRTQVAAAAEADGSAGTADSSTAPDAAGNN